MVVVVTKVLVGLKHRKHFEMRGYCNVQLRTNLDVTAIFTNLDIWELTLDEGVIGEPLNAWRRLAFDITEQCQALTRRKSLIQLNAFSINF